ncbi:MAG TPA: hypothetical protein VIX89_12155 [Bryobacteraceae bacterium]
MASTQLQPVAAGVEDGPQAAPQPCWGLAQRILFRFVFAYLTLYNLAQAGYLVPGIRALSDVYTRLWRPIAPWVAIHVFHLSGPVTVYPAVNGSGDTTLDYIQDLCFVVLAAVATLVWSVLDRKRGEYVRLHLSLRIGMRYVLALTLFSYGFAKVIPTQFIFPGFSRLIEPLGELSPMGLLWNFMGYSTPYIIFSGLAEVFGGALLLLRRTATLGAMASAAVLLNIVMLNFCYDVPVKLYSSNLLLMAIFLMTPDLGRLANMLVLNRPTQPAKLDWPAFNKRWMRQAMLTVKVLFIGYFVVMTVKERLDGYKNFVVGRTKAPLYGLWEVESFARNGMELPPLTTDTNRWKRVIVQSPAGMSIRMMDDSADGYSTSYDAAKNSVTLTAAADKTKKNVFAYSWLGADHLVLTGDGLAVKLRKVDRSKFLLVNRGFHWINERPFNR